ncbi:unnamed protein product [Rangifer tarandus platyrhynchus]|uniref:Uncharacterized protein n=2 Tax=Rangifer tarandus platyrhynchus TaxID=3082113 RepID=A0ACB0EP39_RANTA|nr:unnamed protein product [Rangifer tarandus platyrhynchus]CAI9702440.1 unnamed protein product [Rangifer tarandus platyrhynchus]
MAPPESRSARGRRPARSPLRAHSLSSLAGRKNGGRRTPRGPSQHVPQTERAQAARDHEECLSARWLSQS